MLRQFFAKFKESLTSILPVTLIVVILYFTPLISLSGRELCIFVISAIFLIIGMTFFNLGADKAMQPMGEKVGHSLMKSKKVIIICVICFILGLLITIAEPDLSVLASQVAEIIQKPILIFSVGAGVGLFLVFAVLRIIYKKDLSLILMLSYLLMFALICLLIYVGNGKFLPLALDSGGVTTGPITVPFIMALGVGVASALGGRNASENSFGLIALCSVGPIIAVTFLGIVFKGDLTYTLPDYSISNRLFYDIGTTLLSVAKDVAISLGLIIFFFALVQIIFIKLPIRKLINIGIGILYTFIGLVIFLTAVEIGFMPIGYAIGTQMAAKNPIFIILFAFILGFVVVLAEPAVHVLNRQVEDITNGGVSKTSMLMALAIGVGIAIGLSMIRIVYNFSILYYIIPGYLISLGLSLFVPKLYTAIAFDSGGVASGPLTSSFILPFAIGACYYLQGEQSILTDAFGIVALVALTPLITIQLLGFKSIIASYIHERNNKKKIYDADDEQIINFM
jgi:hypothetical protein